MRWLLRLILARLGARTIVGMATALFLLNLIIPDPLPLIDEVLMLAGTILLSRWAKRTEVVSNPGEPKFVGRGRTHP
jgi:hypothetical protein